MSSQTDFKWQMSTDGPETYERYIVTTWMIDQTHDLINAGGIGPHKRVLDVACGTGIVGRTGTDLVGPDGRLVCVDLNRGMLRVATRCAAEEGVTDIRWCQGDISRMPFSSGDFDTVICQQGLQFFPEKVSSLKEMRRVLSPEGTLVINVLGSSGKKPARGCHMRYICRVSG
ncbi:methyltransferase domain-containing protein [uncultured Methanospirillum sp.]|uniref:class I SAM-dependent methyltransferase n=1 Tax=uncultured Methanospirillum sp. TaxID=262503 RepID=UPI0029C7854C|nr:methyltransferase domain-containing protein [uncultured Methanospirillum sp.]